MDSKQTLLRGAVLIALLVILPITAHAFSFGELQVESRLGERFMAQVPLTLRQDEVAQDIAIGIGLPNDYRVLELDRSLAISSLVVEMTGGELARMIHIRSVEPFREPFFNLLLKTSIGRGSYYRNFPVFLDLLPERVHLQRSELTASAFSVPQAASSPQERSVAGAFPSTQETPPETTYGPVGPVETLFSIARQIQQGEDWSIAQVTVALWKKNRDKFTSDNMSGLRSGVVLDLPDANEITALSATEASAEFQRQWQQWQTLSGRVEPVPADDQPEAEEAVTTPPLPAIAPKARLVGGSQTGEESGPRPQEESPVTMNLTLMPGGVETAESETLQEPDDTLPDEPSGEGIVLQKSAMPQGVAGRQGGATAENPTASRQWQQVEAEVERLTGELGLLTTRLESSENGRLELLDRLARMEAQLAQVNAYQPGGNQAEPPESWDNGLFYGGAGTLLAALVGLLLWMGRQRNEAGKTAQGGEHLEFSGGSAADDPTPEPEGESALPQQMERESEPESVAPEETAPTPSPVATVEREGDDIVQPPDSDAGAEADLNGTDHADQESSPEMERTEAVRADMTGETLSGVADGRGPGTMTGTDESIILDSAVVSRQLAQPLDSSGKLEKSLITNKGTSTFSSSPAKPIGCTAYALPTAESRIMDLPEEEEAALPEGEVERFSLPVSEEGDEDREESPFFQSEPEELEPAVAHTVEEQEENQPLPLSWEEDEGEDRVESPFSSPKSEGLEVLVFEPIEVAPPPSPAEAKGGEKETLETVAFESVDLDAVKGIKPQPTREFEPLEVIAFTPLNLDSAVVSTQSAQPLDSPDKPEKSLITNKVTSIFSGSPVKPIGCTAYALPTAESRLNDEKGAKEVSAPFLSQQNESTAGEKRLSKGKEESDEPVLEIAFDLEDLDGQTEEKR